jgi:hypothetical protein
MMTLVANRNTFARRVMCVGACAWLIATAGAVADEPKLDLKPRFVTGQENRFVVEMHSKTQTQFLDRTRVRLQEYHQRLRVNRKVVETSDTGATLQLKYEAVAVTLVAGNKMLSYDTEGINIPEADQMLGAGVRDAMALTFTVKVDPLGRVVDVTGNEREVTKQAATNLVSDDVLVRSFGPIYGLGKEPAVAAIGETWSTVRKTDPSTTGVYTTTLTSTLTGFADGRATIDQTGVMSLELSEKARLAKAEFTAHDVKGQQIWNVLDGIVDRSAYRQTMEVQADVEARGPLQEEGEIRRREVESLYQVIIIRADDPSAVLPPLPAVLAPVPVTAPDQPPTPIVPPVDAPTTPTTPATPAAPAPADAADSPKGESPK